MCTVTGCLKSRKPSQLAGDIFFDFVCTDCSESGVEEFEHQKLLWFVLFIIFVFCH